MQAERANRAARERFGKSTKRGQSRLLPFRQVEKVLVQADPFFPFFPIFPFFILAARCCPPAVAGDLLGGADPGRPFFDENSAMPAEPLAGYRRKTYDLRYAAGPHD
jgi:hypothetical protein